MVHVGHAVTQPHTVVGPLCNVRKLKMMLRNRLEYALRRWVNAADGNTYVTRFERTKQFRPISRVSVSFDGSVYRVHDGTNAIHVARKSRLGMQYKNGLLARRRSLAAEYCLQEGLLNPDDVVIDCGANIGEFSIICAEAGASVFAFEPDKTEFLALGRNAEERDITPFQVALWNKNGSMKFFDSNNTGDSSLFDPGRSFGSYLVETKRLDDMVEVPKTDIRLIKLEAEGAEPEILEGMRETLGRTQFVTVDMGPERGLTQENTVTECSEFLWDAGFRMRAFFHARCSALFERRSH